jgi:peptidyl-prolyl cis-trans isomerase SurA
MAMQAFSQSLFTYGGNEVSKEEFVRAFNKNMDAAVNKEAALKEYLQLYTAFKLKVKAAKELKLDTLDQLKYDMMNFRERIQYDYMLSPPDILAKVNYKRNPAVKDEMLWLYADSAAFASENYQCPIAKELIFSMGAVPVKVADWLAFAREYKLNKQVPNGESNDALLNKFIDQTTADYYRKHLEEYNADFKYQLQEFKEGNLYFEVMGKKVWNKSAMDDAILKAYYEANQQHFVWNESADVILINARSYAYADFAFENMKTGMYWKNIAGNSEGMIQGDSSRYEIAQLPVKAGPKLEEGKILEIVKSATDNSASFVKVIKVYPPKTPMSFEEAKTLLVNEYQQKLEDAWMKELTAKYPVKVNTQVFQSLLK